MPDREIIHASGDVATVLRFALGAGLVVRMDAPSDAATPTVLTDDSLDTQVRGSFALYRPEWVFGEPQFRLIAQGHNKGRYTQSSRVNCAPIVVFFSGERMEGDALRLGGGVISWHKTWYRSRDRIERPSPPEVGVMFDAISNHFDTRNYLSGGGHRYLVLAEAWRKLTDGAAIPPFDYIEWQPPGKT